MTPATATLETPETKAETASADPSLDQLKGWIERLPPDWHQGSSLSWAQFWRRPDRGKLLLIDIRDDVARHEVPGAIHIPMGSFLSQMLKHELIDEDEEVLLFCNTENRSAIALFLTRSFGYSGVKMIHGGYQEYLRLSSQGA